MYTTVEGVFRGGHVELRETPEDIQEDALVIVTFLTRAGRPSVQPAATEERLRTFQALVASLPEAPAVPLEALDRENLYP